jgi:hypothetical protein
MAIYLENPIIRTSVIEFDRFKIKNFEITLNEKVKIIILLFPVNPEHIIEAMTITIEGDEYANWGSDDEYLINLIKQKIRNGNGMAGHF